MHNHSRPVTCQPGYRQGVRMDIETVLDETVSTEDLKKFEQKYHLELKSGKVTKYRFLLQFQLFVAGEL